MSACLWDDSESVASLDKKWTRRCGRIVLSPQGKIISVMHRHSLILPGSAFLLEHYFFLRYCFLYISGKWVLDPSSRRVSGTRPEITAPLYYRALSWGQSVVFGGEMVDIGGIGVVMLSDYTRSSFWRNRLRGGGGMWTCHLQHSKQH